MAIAILTTLFVFPETMSYAIMIKVSAQLARVERLVQMQDAVLGALAADLRADAPLIQQFRRLRSFVIGEQQQRAYTLFIYFFYYIILTLAQ
jgi:hypothetical protein